ncbi:hypothetical protein POJ06DRAFT_270438 [Lipomyces tetrasporus]|uniref:Uncharacterized protein n=1 Tax=Lipomyces tetrasporus TaxID=54092 RepID=A0AAD7QN67_9ASCO|nr:uncharacterized protein POJ06DRAFT_270438 [Lipomyces tetrasporus]KAJ8098472.1 hypothetical protein POJ06DRAFT_270438 [Lipomyces tetrasporus]
MREFYRKILEFIIFKAPSQVCAIYVPQKYQHRRFIFKIDDMPLLRQSKLKESKGTFKSYMNINVYLLQSFQLQSLNKTAAGKTLEKFDMLTDLIVRDVFLAKLFQWCPAPSPSRFEVDKFRNLEQLLSAIPQPNDYICPTC